MSQTNQVSARLADLSAALAGLRDGAYRDAAMLAAPWHARDAADVEAATLVALALAGSGQAAPAATLLWEVARLRPEAAHPITDAIALLDTHRAHGPLRALLDAALVIDDANPRLLVAAGAWLQQTGETGRALAVLAKARRLAPHSVPAKVAEAAALADSGEVGAAIRQLRGLIDAGQADAAAWSNLGTMLTLRNEFPEADAAFREATRLDPKHWTILFNHGMTLLKWGRLREGWPSFNMRLHLPGHALLPLHRLLPRLAPGQRLDGKTVLITHDSGFGDTLQFIRYAPLLAARGARVLLWVPEPLRRLMASVAGIADVFTDRSIWPLHDHHCPIMRLPDVFATTLADIPAALPYFAPSPADVAAWSARLGSNDPRLRVGLCWAGSSREGDPRLQAVDRRRSLTADTAIRLVNLAPRYRWISLQLGRPEPLPIENPMSAVRDFADTAALIANLDVVVSVDTAVAHLAAGLGKTVLMLDRYDNCWRWLHSRADTPWYPSLRILRQAAWGDWSVPLRLTVAALLELRPAFRGA